ncbi:MAG TPA: hypothetical protein DCL31_05930 [Clostridium sp.]|nr:hypothetical protein [Clostridium sp.]
MKVQAQNISAELMKLLSDKEEYAVHSCFESGFNIKVNKFLCFVGNRQNTKLPYGILLKEQHISPLLELMNGRKISFLWNKEMSQLVTEEITIELKGCKSFSSFLDQKPCKISRCCFDLHKDNIDMNMKTGLGVSLGQLINEDNRARETLYSSFQSKEKDFIKSVLLKWVGYGLGLTPAGDDFLVGILFAHRICNILSEEFLEELEEIIKEEKYTTDISTHYYISAFENCYNDALLDMYQALITVDKKMMRKSIDEILEFGHTSGRDMMAGILVGVNLWIKKLQTGLGN